MLAAALAVAAGCEKQEAGIEPKTASAPTASSIVSPAASTEAKLQAGLARGDMHEPQPMFEGAYAPVSKTAQAITDEIAFEADTIQFGFGHTYETAPESMIRQGDAAGRGFTDALSVPAGTYVEVRKVASELVNPRAENGGLCKPDATTWIVLAAVRNPDGVTRDVSMAAYKGQAAPTPATAERDLCGTFSYTRANTQ